LTERKYVVDDKKVVDDGVVRTFGTGASRTSEAGKMDPEGFNHPLVEKRYYEYMDKHRHMPDGSLRGSDNWWNLFGENHYDVCIKSLFRHVMDLWLHHRGFGDVARDIEAEAICAIIFNAKAYLLKLLLEEREKSKELERSRPTETPFLCTCGNPMRWNQTSWICDKCGYEYLDENHYIKEKRVCE